MNTLVNLILYDLIRNYADKILLTIIIILLIIIIIQNSKKSKG